ncbi:MAG: hypothetical protein AABZ64_04135, partial [Nitrospinota bacterium]
MMGLYGTLGLVAALAALGLAAAWLYFRRSRRRAEFPADAWEPYLQQGGAPTPWGTGVPDEVEKMAGGAAASEPEGQYVALPPASDGSMSSRMKTLEAIPISAGEEKKRAGEEERRRAEADAKRKAGEAARAGAPAPPPIEGGADLLDLLASSPEETPPPRAAAPAPSPPPAAQAAG